MANKYTNELYEKIKGSFSEHNKGTYNNVLKTKATNTYIVRFIPNVDDPSKTLYQYYLHGWNSTVDGRYVSTVCPSTYGEECPICTERFRLWNKGDEASKALSAKLARKERYYANVYVIDDPTNEANNGTVKIFGYGRQISKIINEAMLGDDADEIGSKMFEFAKNGCNLRIKVEKNSAGYPNYSSSKFLSPSSIPVSLDDLLNDIHDFDPLLTRKTQKEMEEMLESALYGSEIEDKPVNEVVTASEKASIKEDDIPMDFDDGGSDNDDSDAILAELENLVE
jgi:hypothetical protein